MATILVVDDSNLSRKTSRRILEGGGYRVRGDRIDIFRKFDVGGENDVASVAGG